MADSTRGYKGKKIFKKSNVLDIKNKEGKRDMLEDQGTPYFWPIPNQIYIYIYKFLKSETDAIRLWDHFKNFH